jgi:hypothetical protein
MPADLKGTAGSVTGYVRDLACPYRNRSKEAAKPPDDVCVKACTKAGAPLGIITPDGTIFNVISYTMPDTDERARLVPYVAKAVRATGQLFERNGAHAIAIDKIEAPFQLSVGRMNPISEHPPHVRATHHDFWQIRQANELEIILAMNRAVSLSQTHHLALRAAGLFMWVFLAVPVFDRATRNGEPISGTLWIIWLVLFFFFAPAFWISSSTHVRALWIQIAALALQTGCVLGMTSIYQGYLIGFLLVIVCWEVALIMPVNVAIAWAAIDSGLWIYFQEPHYHLGCDRARPEHC